MMTGNASDLIEPRPRSDPTVKSTRSTRQPPPEPPRPDKLLTSTGYLLVQTGRESRRRWMRLLAGHGLSAHQFGILMALTDVASASQRRLSEMIDLDPRNAVSAFDGLEQRGLLERRTNSADRRSHAITLTPTGRQLTDRLAEAGRATELEMLTPLSDAERALLQQLLLKLYSATAPPA